MRLAALLLAAMLAGCASDPTWLENRIACTPDGTELHVISKWGAIEFGSQMSDADAAAVCSPAK